MLPHAARYLLRRPRYDEAQARILCCDIKGGTECVRCCDGSRLVLEACTLSDFRVVRLLSVDWSFAVEGGGHSERKQMQKLLNP